MLARQRHKAEIAQHFMADAIGFAVHAHHLLVVAALADRYNEDAAGFELLNEGRGYRRRSGCDQDPVVRRLRLIAF